MRLLNLYKNFLIVLAADVVLITASLYGAYLARFDFQIPAAMLKMFFYILPYTVGIKLAAFYYFDLYRGMWRYAGVNDLLNVIKAASIALLLVMSVVLFLYRFQGFSRSVFVIDWCFTILLTAGYRLSIRIYFEALANGGIFSTVERTLLALVRIPKGEKRRLLIIGAGDCGEKIYREIQSNAQLPYQVVGFLDDDAKKVGKKIHGVTVLSRIDDVQRVVQMVKADELLIAVPSATSKQMRHIVARCKASGIRFRTVPGIGELINGKISVGSIREVAYRDLLGREVIRLDTEKIGAYLMDRNVLVTGAGGSIGSELCRQICRFSPRLLILFERAESPLYDMELELRDNFPEVKIVTVLGDVQDQEELTRVFDDHRPNVVFHAAAYKHVPMLEIQPWKAILNNVMGTYRLVEVANTFQIDRFVLVSTDKAVRPSSAMGASKRVAEMLVQNQNACENRPTRFMTVRFGNVVNSVGSVVPLFRKQIERGGPVTVTDPEVTRYFMTIPEACQLILQAGALENGQGGEIYLLKMGTPIRISDLARDLIRFYGFEPDKDIPIVYTGLRPGEKLYEELIVDGEDKVPTTHEKIVVLRGLSCNPQILNGKIDKLNRIARQRDREKIIETLKEIVPDYQPASHSRNGSSLSGRE